MSMPLFTYVNNLLWKESLDSDCQPTPTKLSTASRLKLLNTKKNMTYGDENPGPD